MLYKVFGFLLKNDGLYKYTPHPIHFFYVLLLLGVGTATLKIGWYFVGFMSSLFGVLLGITIILGMNWEKATAYWEAIASVFDAAVKIKDSTTRYELLKSMGYKVLPSQVEIIETRQDEYGIFQGQSIKRYPISPAIMQTIADKVLGEYITKGSVEFDFKEDKFDFVPRLRQVKNKFKEDNLITAKNKKNVRLGYRWTRKGIDELYQYASEGVKLELKRKKEMNGT
jgi:hypothetical protein